MHVYTYILYTPYYTIHIHRHTYICMCNVARAVCTGRFTRCNTSSPQDTVVRQGWAHGGQRTLPISLHPSRTVDCSCLSVMMRSRCYKETISSTFSQCMCGIRSANLDITLWGYFIIYEFQIRKKNFPKQKHRSLL